MALNHTDESIGQREELKDVIWRITPTDTPFLSNMSRGSAEATLFEWQTDTLAAVSADVAIEGAIATYAAGAPTTRVFNRTQINEKTAEVSRTLEQVSKAGRGSEMALQELKRGQELKKDLEHQLVGIHNAQNAGGASTARETASYITWMNANFSNATGGSPATPTGDGTDTGTVGTTARVFGEPLLGAIVDSVYASGGNPDIIMCNTFQKRKLSGFTGNASVTNIERDTGVVSNSVSVYESDYGTMNVVPNRICKITDVLVYQKDMWELSVLSDMKSTEMAKIGDSDRKQIVMESGLYSKNGDASGIIVGLTTS